jgi:hypothetical protein
MMPAGADIFASDARYLVDPVDCTGAQGAGLALAFAQRFRADCAWFKDIAQVGDVFEGGVFIRGYDSGRVVFFPTKRRWRDPSLIEDVRDGLDTLVTRLLDIEAPSVAVPALGCGLGSLAWDDVRPLILAAAERLSARGVRVEVYPPHEERGSKGRKL